MSGAPATRTTKGRAEAAAAAEAEASAAAREESAASSVAASDDLFSSSLDSDERGFSSSGAAERERGAAPAVAAASALPLLPAPGGLTPAAWGATACSFRRSASQVLSSCRLAPSEGSGEGPEGGGRGALTRKTMKHQRPSVETSPLRTARPQSRRTRAASQPRPVASGQLRRTSRSVGSSGDSGTGLFFFFWGGGEGRGFSSFFFEFFFAEQEVEEEGGDQGKLSIALCSLRGQNGTSIEVLLVPSA